MSESKSLLDRVVGFALALIFACVILQFAAALIDLRTERGELV